MSEHIVNTLVSIFVIILGLWIAIYSKHHASKTSEFYLKLLNIRFSQKGYKFAFLIGGIIFVILGFLGLFQIIHFK